MLPHHPFLVLWSKLIAVAVAYAAVWIPMQAAFDEDLTKPESLWFTVNVLVDCIFIADVALVFNTAFKKQGMWVFDRKQITNAYLRGAFTLDFIAAFPYALLVIAVNNDWPWNHDDNNGFSNLTIVRALRLLRLLRVVIKLMRNGNDVAEVVSGGATRFNPAIVRVCQLVLMLVLACHWVGCLWWLVGTIDGNSVRDDSDTWGPDTFQRSQGLGARYLHAFNWGAGMILAFVPNDVQPQEVSEVLVTVVAMFVGFFMGMVFISAATSALQVHASCCAVT